MKNIHWKGRREKYQQEHDANLRRFQMIKRKLYTLKTDKGTLLIKGWKQELLQLDIEHQAIYQKYKPLQDMLKIQQCVNSAMHKQEHMLDHEQAR